MVRPDPIGGAEPARSSVVSIGHIPDEAELIFGGRCLGAPEIRRRVYRLLQVLRGSGIDSSKSVGWLGEEPLEALIFNLAGYCLGAKIVGALSSPSVDDFNTLLARIADGVLVVDHAMRDQVPSLLPTWSRAQLIALDEKFPRNESEEITCDFEAARHLTSLAAAVGPGPVRCSVLDALSRQGSELILAALLGGGIAIVITEDHPARILAALERIECTHLGLPFDTLWKLANDPAATMTDLSTLRHITYFGVAPIQSELDEVIDVFGPIVAPVPASLQAEIIEPVGDGPTVHRFVETAATAAQVHAEGISVEQVRTFIHRLDHAALLSMVHALQQRGVLTRPEQNHTQAEILTAADVAPEHRRLIERWLNVLVVRGLLQCKDGRLYGISPVDRTAFDAAWQSASDMWSGTLGSHRFLDYLRRNAERLPELMTGEQHAALLLFPEGRTEIADAVYRDTAIARYLNTAVSSFLSEIISASRGVPVRALEIGAGTGATTDAVVAALSGPGNHSPSIEYLFTDLSNFFLTTARRRLAAQTWIRFALFDIDQELRVQQFSPRSVDVIIAVGVLNNARDIHATMRWLVELLVPGGWLLIAEPTREHLEILTSQAFMITTAEDTRASSGTTFLSVQQWLDVLSQVGAECVSILPDENNPLAPLGQRLFVGRT
jgi:SAM-dependent methyltransferase